MIEFLVKSGDPQKQRVGCLVTGLTSHRRLTHLSEQIDKTSEGYLKKILSRGDCEGKLYQWLLLHHVPHIAPERVLLLGLGTAHHHGLNEREFGELITRMILTLNETGTKDLVLPLHDFHVKDRDLFWKIRQTIQIIETAFYRFDDFKTQQDQSKTTIQRVIFMVSSSRELKAAERAVEEGVAISHGLKVTKDLANLPANICTPSYLADFAKKFAKKQAKISTAVLEEKDMAALGMGLLLSVTQGSKTPAKLISIEYRGSNKKKKPIVLVGKGITFDTGGNSIKPAMSMIGMKYDMCGAAAVLGVLTAAAQLELPLNIVGIIPTCENMPGAEATRPEDIVTSMSGQTVEILNTDAEGRLILADALTYSERFHPEVVIDIATLTGACTIALGPYASALMSNYQPLAEDLIKSSKESGDKVWQLPLWEEYHDALKSEFADMSNIPIADIGGKTIIAGCFLEKFAKKFHWAHLDIANTCQLIGMKRSASGRPVPLLVQYLLDRCHEEKNLG